MYKQLAILALAALVLPTSAGASTCPPLAPGRTGEVDHCPSVFRLTCEAPGGQRTLTAFHATAGGRTGLLTALHGAVGCERLRAWNLGGSPGGLVLEAVDFDRDLALLAATGPGGAGIRAASSWTETDVRVVGYPTGITGQYAHDLTLDAIALRPLSRIMAPASQRAIESRGTPSLDARFMSLAGPLSPGYSGAPILTPAGEVLGVAIGGNVGGVAQVGFGSPLSDVAWVPAASARSRLERLARLASEGLFSDASVSPPPPAPLPTLLVTDARDRQGRILKLEGGTLRTFYTWGKGTIYNLAWHPRMGLLFSNSNDRNLNVLAMGATATIFEHDTYLRDVAVDPVRNDVYFSESTGAGNDGTIYRLRNKRAERYRTIRLEEVDGSWAGDFAFDPDGNLWLSSGNRAPANLYRVDRGRTVRVFSSPRPIKGFSFIDRETIVYTDWKQRLYRLSLRDLSVTEIGAFGVVEWMGDVTVFPR